MLSNDKKSNPGQEYLWGDGSHSFAPIQADSIYNSRTHIPMQHSTKYVDWTDVLGDGILTWQFEAWEGAIKLSLVTGIVESCVT